MGDLHCNPVSDESLALMRGWINNCDRSHQLCRIPRQVGGPKRLLQCLSDGSVRLASRSPNQRCDYIALSYRWGDGTAVPKTTTQTVGFHQRGIPNKALPPLFQEVAALARRVNVGYIWIDSLCIIQDSPKDREEEMMEMGRIFRGALVVVVAASARSPRDSLKGQPGQSNAWRTASLIRYEKRDLNVKFRKRPWEAHLYTDATDSTPTGERAWCFQERLLASRCLVFRDDEVVWECRSCCLCECGGRQEHFSAGDSSMVPMMKPYRQMLLPLAAREPFQRDGTLRHFADAEAAYSFWETAVKNSSARALTFDFDRLPAISAVARTIAEATGDRYLAGLWRNDLLVGLGWVANGPENETRRHQEYIAPTWSWASLPVGAFYRRRRSRHDCAFEASVLDARTALKGQNPFGPVSDGAIVLSGVHCDAEMTIQTRDFNGQLDFGHGQVEKVCIGSTDFQTLDFIRVEPDIRVDRLGRTSQYLRRSPNLYRSMDPKSKNAQPLCSGTVHLLWLEKDVSLILTPSRRRAGAYERLGIFHRGQGPKMPKRVARSSITLV